MLYLDVVLCCYYSNTEEEKSDIGCNIQISLTKLNLDDAIVQHITDVLLATLLTRIISNFPPPPI